MTAPTRPEAVELVELLVRLLPRDEREDFAERISAALDAAEARGEARGIERAAQECERIYRSHKHTKRYPMDMGGLATECAAAIRALVPK